MIHLYKGTVFSCLIGTALSMYACRMTTKGVEYSGSQSQTASGLECQRWDSQHPHAHSHTEEFHFAENNVSNAENFCRNPSNEEGGPWCLTTDASVEKELCNVPFCAPYEDQCKTDNKGKEFIGRVNYTASGKICQSWSQQSPHPHERDRLENFPDEVEDVADIRNFCRNPDNEPGPWCYTLDSAERWELCEIPLCADGPEISSIYINHELQSNLTLVDGNFSSCDSFVSDNFRLQLLTPSPWMQLTVEFAFNSNTLIDCDSAFFAYFSSSELDTCGPMTPCRWQPVHSTLEKKFCRFTCSCDSPLCQSLTLQHALLPEAFELCEVTIF